MIKKILYVVLTLLLGGLVGVWANKTIKQLDPANQTTPTPASNAASQTRRQESAIASHSAFLTAVSSVASLSASVSSLTINDTTFGPPVIELPLGFTDTR